MEQKGSERKKKQKREKGLEMSCKRRLSCFFSRRQDREKGNTCLLFPFAFNSEKGYHSMKSNSSKFETEGREHFITARRAGRWTLALQSLRATAACALKKKKGLGICEEHNIHIHSCSREDCRQKRATSTTTSRLWKVVLVVAECLKTSKMLTVI